MEVARAEQQQNQFDIGKIIKESKETLLSPATYFAGIQKTGGFLEPIIKVLVYGLVAGAFYFLWSVLGLSSAGAFGAMLGGGVGIMALVAQLIFAVIGLFIGAVIILIISAICGGSTDFEANLRVSASLMVLAPINAILSVLGGLNLWLGGVVSLIVSLYGLWLLYNALTKALGGKEGVARVIAIVLAVLLALSVISSLTCYKAATGLSEKYGKQAEKMMEQMPQDMDQEKAKKMVEELQKMEKKADQ